jgi:hypothetical protein
MDWSKFLSRKFLVLVAWISLGAVLLLFGRPINDVLEWYKATSTAVLGYLLGEAGVDAVGAFGRQRHTGEGEGL